MFLTAQSHHRSPQVVYGNFCLRQFSVFFFFEKIMVPVVHVMIQFCIVFSLSQLFLLSLIFSNIEPILIDVFSMFHRLSIKNFSSF